MRILLTADLHLTDRENDSYRWEIWNRLRAAAEDYECTHAFILGDLTDKKDRHPSSLVNRIVAQCVLFYEQTGIPLFVVKGNHDYVDEKEPFFAFLSLLDGVDFVVKPSSMEKKSICIIPHSREPNWEITKIPRSAEVVLTHHTFHGAHASNGIELEGHDANTFDYFEGRVFSGDIHVPQIVGEKIEYVGSPYPVHFGDRYTPRLVVWDSEEDEVTSLPYKGVRKEKLVISRLSDLKGRYYKEGDQVKVVIKAEGRTATVLRGLRQSAREYLEENGVKVAGIQIDATVEIDDTPAAKVAEAVTPRRSFDAFCDREGVDDHARDVGHDILSDSDGEA